MSNLLNELAHCEPGSCAPCSAIRTILQPRDKALGGFTVRRLMPSDALKALGPFVFFDHLGPAQFQPGTGIDVRPHPHIGLATVTYLFDGEILHRDSLGNVQPIRPGEINWMTAGRGIVHSERTPPGLRGHRQPLERHRGAAGEKLLGEEADLDAGGETGLLGGIFGKCEFRRISSEPQCPLALHSFENKGFTETGSA